MATNQFLPFGIGAGANVLSPAAYAALAARTGGFTSGTAKSQELNSVWRQAAFGVSALAQFIADQSGDDVLDDGNIANFKASLIKAINLLNLNAGYGVDTGSANTYQVAYTPAITTLVDGLRLRFRAKTTNTTLSTFSPNGTTPKEILSKAHTSLIGAEIVANGDVEVVWNSALGAWVLLENTGGADQLPVWSYGTTPGFGDASRLVPTTEYIQQAMSAALTKNLSGSNVTLTAVEARYPIIILTGTLTANINVIVPASSREWIVFNNTAGAFTVTFKTASGTGYAVVQGTATNLFCDGTNVVLSGVTSPAQSVQGAFKNLQLNSTGSSTQVFVVADELVVESTAGVFVTLRNLNIAGSTTSALDIGSVASNTGYYVWVVYNGASPIVLFSLSATSPVMPGGYTYKARVGWIYTDGAGSFFPLPFTQRGRRVLALPRSTGSLQKYRQLASGILGNPNSAGQLVSVSLTNFIPATATAVQVSLYGYVSGGSAIVAPSTPQDPVPTSNPSAQVSMFASISVGASAGATWLTHNCLIPLNEMALYYASNVSQSGLNLIGWEDSL